MGQYSYNLIMAKCCLILQNAILVLLLEWQITRTRTVSPSALYNRSATFYQEKNKREAKSSRDRVG